MTWKYTHVIGHWNNRWYNWNIVESGIKHHYPLKQQSLGRNVALHGQIILTTSRTYFLGDLYFQFSPDNILEICCFNISTILNPAHKNKC
jgi:hypothetical protein